MVSVWFAARAMLPLPLTLPVKVTLPLLALVVDSEALLRVIQPPKILMGPAMLVLLPMVILAVLVALPIVKPLTPELRFKLVSGQLNALVKLLFDVG